MTKQMLTSEMLAVIAEHARNMFEDMSDKEIVELFYGNMETAKLVYDDLFSEE